MGTQAKQAIEEGPWGAKVLWHLQQAATLLGVAFGTLAVKIQDGRVVRVLPEASWTPEELVTLQAPPLPAPDPQPDGHREVSSRTESHDS